jgi:hypothetical protein
MSDTEDDMRAALDQALVDCMYFTMVDTDGHVDCVDGYIDTGDLAESVIENLTAAGWTFTVDG